jgi:hypothetical protein
MNFTKRYKKQKTKNIKHRGNKKSHKGGMFYTPTRKQTRIKSVWFQSILQKGINAVKAVREKLICSHSNQEFPNPRHKYGTDPEKINYKKKLDEMTITKFIDYYKDLAKIIMDLLDNYNIPIPKKTIKFVEKDKNQVVEILTKTKKQLEALKYTVSTEGAFNAHYKEIRMDFANIFNRNKKDTGSYESEVRRARDTENAEAFVKRLDQFNKIRREGFSKICDDKIINALFFGLGIEEVHQVCRIYTAILEKLTEDSTKQLKDDLDFFKEILKKKQELLRDSKLAEENEILEEIENLEKTIKNLEEDIKNLEIQDSQLPYSVILENPKENLEEDIKNQDLSSSGFLGLSLLYDELGNYIGDQGNEEVLPEQLKKLTIT